MHPKVQEYIDRINANDPKLTRIDLECLYLGDAGIAPLIAALTRNQGVAQRITDLELSHNELTVMPNLTGLEALNHLDLSVNHLKTALCFSQVMFTIRPGVLHPRTVDLRGNEKLTVATKMLLNAVVMLIDGRPLGSNFAMYNRPRSADGLNFVNYSGPRPANILLTNAILDEHFRSILQVNPDEIMNYFKNPSIAEVLSYELPTIAENKISWYIINPPQIERARSSMDNFMDIFGQFARLNNDYTQLNILNAYMNAEFKALANKVENHYYKVFCSIGCIIGARRAAERASAVIAIEPAAKTPILFSSIPPATEKAKNNTIYCGFEAGFINKKMKLGLFN